MGEVNAINLEKGRIEPPKLKVGYYSSPVDEKPVNDDFVFLPQTIDPRHSPIFAVGEIKGEQGRKAVDVLLDGLETAERDFKTTKQEYRDPFKLLSLAHTKIREQIKKPDRGLSVLVARFNNSNFDRLDIAWAGDVKLYLYRKGSKMPSRKFESDSDKSNLSLMNKPISLLEQSGVDSNWKDNNSQHLSQIAFGTLRFLGEKKPLIGNDSLDIQEGDVLLMVTDGIRVGERKIEKILDGVAGNKLTPDQASKRLADETAFYGNTDDVTALIVQIKERPKEYLLSKKQMETLKKAAHETVPATSPDPKHWGQYIEASRNIELIYRGKNEIGDEYIRRIFKRVGLVEAVLQDIGVGDKLTPGLIKFILNWSAALEYHLYYSQNDSDVKKAELDARYKSITSAMDLLLRSRVLHANKVKVMPQYNEHSADFLTKSLEDKRENLKRLGREVSVW